MSMTIGGITINRNPVYPLDPYSVRWNQKSVDTADAGRATYDNGPNVIYGTLLLKSVAKSEGDALKTYLLSTAIFGKSSFVLSPPSNTDLGKGDGVNITVFYSGGNSLEGVFNLIPPRLYDIAIPYREAI